MFRVVAICLILPSVLAGASRQERWRMYMAVREIETIAELRKTSVWEKVHQAPMPEQLAAFTHAPGGNLSLIAAHALRKKLPPEKFGRLLAIRILNRQGGIDDAKGLLREVLFESTTRQELQGVLQALTERLIDRDEPLTHALFLLNLRNWVHL